MNGMVQRIFATTRRRQDIGRTFAGAFGTRLVRIGCRFFGQSRDNKQAASTSAALSAGIVEVALMNQFTIAATRREYNYAKNCKSA